MEKVDLTNYERQIDQLVDEAIDCVASKFVDACGQDPQQISDYNKVYHQIQDYLVEKWTKEKHDRFINQKLKEAEETTRERIKNEPDFGRIGFLMTEQQSKIVQVLQELGYQTETCYEEGYEWVEYWKEGKRPEPDNGV